jgi:hypothetical protein
MALRQRGGIGHEMIDEAHGKPFPACPSKPGADVPLFSIGDRVSQSNYGDGTVTTANEYHTIVDFDVHGLHTFSSPLVRLERSMTLAPPKVVKTRRRAKST